MPEHTGRRRVTEAAENQFISSFQMLCVFTAVCPDEVWNACFFGFPYPVWYQVYHTARAIDDWLQDDYRGERELCKSFDSRIPPEFEHPPEAGLLITQEEMRDYLSLLLAKIRCFFARLCDEWLGVEISEQTANFTYADVLFGQNRHVMYNVGYLNAILRSLGLEESDWYSYNEPND